RARCRVRQAVPASRAPGAPLALVADGAMITLGTAARIAEPLTRAGHPVLGPFAVNGEPKCAEVDAMVAGFAGAAGVIALGGGAALDAAKLAACLAAASEPETQALDHALAARPLPAAALPLIALPTTAGTGSEVTRTAVATGPDGAKLWYWADALLPARVVLDPELTLSLPAHITAWTGMDAVAHALEAASSARATPPGIAFGTAALTILAEALPRAVADGSDIAARGDMLWGACLAGRAIEESGTHLGHAISHALGSLAPVHHGHATALALEATLPWLVGTDAAATRFAPVARAIGAETPAALPARFSALMRSVGISAALPEAARALSSSAVAEAMQTAANAPMLSAAPRPLDAATVAEVAALVTGLGAASPAVPA
ncbi:MAG: iron-containing alcohol dehydrogenase, partial [Pseudomonadota bacterium]